MSTSLLINDPLLIAEKLNLVRLSRATSNSSILENALFTIIPYFLQHNRPELPGFISHDMPTGITLFSDDSAMHRACQVLSVPYFASLPNDSEQHINAFEGVYAMGSTASFGQNSQSDIDVWLVHQASLSSAALQLISQKIIKLTEWFARFEFEVNFYLIHPMQFRQCALPDSNQSLGVENSGSSQHWLLLEEFYRTHIRLAGKTVAWWPTADEQTTEEYLNSVLYLGNVAELPATEYFGASLWQLYKGLNKPHKALLKVLLLETYAHDYPRAQLLSTQVWALCAADNFSVENDSYFLLYQRIENYLIGQNDLKRLDVVRQCFYLKCDVKLTEFSDQITPDWRALKIKQLVESWNWSDTLIHTLDYSSQWHSGQLKWFNQQLNELLMCSYKTLLNFASKHALSDRMRVEELGLLARKLHTVFSTDDHHLGKLNALWSHMTQERYLTIIKSSKTSRFHLYRQPSDKHRLLGESALVEADNVCTLVAWSVLNKLSGPRTRWQQLERNQHRHEKLSLLASKLASKMSDTFTVSKWHLCQPWFYQKVILITNLDNDPTAKWQGQELMQGYFDSNVFSMGKARKNMLSTIDVITLNSWGEWQSHRFDSQNALLEAMSFIALGVRRASDDIELGIINCSLKLNHQITNQLRRLIFTCYGLIKRTSTNNTLMYPLQVGEFRYGLSFNALGMMYKKIEEESLPAPSEAHIASVSLPRPERDYDLYASAPSIILKYVASGVKQFFLRENNSLIDVFLVDEDNQLSHQQLANVSMTELVSSESQHFVFKDTNPDFNMPQFFKLVSSEGELKVVPFGISKEESGSNF